jgi:hypothetical protein
MTSFAGKREIQAIAVLLGINVFLGLSDKTTQFIWPDFGAQVFELVRFYLLAMVVFMAVVLWLAQNHNIPALPRIPSIWSVILNFIIFLIPSYLILSFIIQGQISTIPNVAPNNFIEQGLIALDENLLAFILLASVFPLGTGTGNMFRSPWTLIKIADYRLDFNPPNFNRFKYGLYAILYITLLHAGAYSYQVSTAGEFFSSLLIAFILFMLLWLIKETFGYGACVASHLSWNLILIGVRGSVI